MERSAKFNPAAFGDVPLYNIQAVSAATGVPSITLRSWERRYGIPRPKRDPKGYRLYSDRDIAVARWLKERVQQGVGISRAVNMLEVLETGDAPVEDAPRFDYESLRTRLLGAIERLDEDAVNRVIGEALVTGTVEDVALLVLQPVLYRIGELWAAGSMSVTVEHVGSNLLRTHLAQLIRLSSPPHRSIKILVGSAPGELHDIGALVLALFLRRRGFDVLYAGANLEADSLLADVERLAPMAVCLSATTKSSIPSLRYVFEHLAAHNDCIRGFGGRVFNEFPELAEGISGTLLGPDAVAAVSTLETLLADRHRPADARNSID